MVRIKKTSSDMRMNSILREVPKQETPPGIGYRQSGNSKQDAIDVKWIEWKPLMGIQGKVVVVARGAGGLGRGLSPSHRHCAFSHPMERAKPMAP